MRIELEKSFSRKIARSIERFNFEVGVLNDAPHKEPVQATNAFQSPPLKTYAGGPARKTSLNVSAKTTGQVLVDNMTRMNRNILLEPFEKKSSDIIRFTQAFLNMAIAKGSRKRVENLLQAIVRNPILKGEYGPNRAVTANTKGFDRKLIDTAQMFRAIKARVKRV